MATLCALLPCLSSSLVFPHISSNHFSFLKSKPNSQFKKPVSMSSVLSVASDSQIPQSVQTSWQWLYDQGVVSSKTPVRPGLVPEGLGLVATRDINKGEVVLEVPKRFWINPDAVAASEIGNVCFGLKPWIYVALFLLREKSREDSKWKHYIDILPESTDSTIYWSEEELAEIQGTQLLSTTLGVKEYVENEFHKVEEEVILRNKELFSFAITLDDFFWAFGILRSRAFSRLRNQNLVIIPFADLVNHSDTVTTEDHAHEVRGPAGLFSWDYLFSLRSPLTLKAGEQDEKLLEEGNLCTRHEMAAKIRVGEKKVLQHIEKVFKERESELDGLEYYQERRLKDLGLVGEQGEIIFWE